MSRTQEEATTQLNRILADNIEALRALEQERRENRSTKEKILGGITAFAGSLAFVVVHAAILIFWLVANTGHLGIKPWDPYPFVMLAMAASVEAIFISTFVLIGQNNQSRDADRRAELNLQIDLLAEHEITRLVEMVEAIAAKLDVRLQVADLDEISKDVDAVSVVEQLDQTARS